MTVSAGFGGGCHWCTEAVFQHVAGVVRVEQGFAVGPAPHDAPSEAAWVAWDEDAVPLARLIAVHLDTHAATSDHAMRGKYRSAVYVTGDAQAEAARRVLAEEARRRGPLVTLVLPLVRFERSPERYRDYYRRRPDAPFCQTYIAPKLARVDGALDQSVMGGAVRKTGRSG